MANKAGYIFAKRDQDTTRFTEMAWKHMSPKMKDGKRDGAWTQISEEEYERRASGSFTSSGLSADVDTSGAETETKYRQIMEQAKGLTKDGKHAEALAKYQSAEVLKPSTYLTGVINKATTAVEAQAAAAAKALAEGNADQGRANLVNIGQKSLKSGDFETALSMFEEAQAMEATEDVAAMIVKANEAQDASMAE